MPTAASHVWRPSRARRVVLDGFVPVPRGVVPAAMAAPVWPAKDPADVLDYEFDIAAALVGNRGDSIASIDVLITPALAGDLVMNSVTADGATAIFWFAKGQIGVNYQVSIAIGTANGRTINRVILLPVQALTVGALPAVALTTSNGTVITDQNGNPILVGG